MFMAPAVSPSLGMLVATAELFRESITRGDGWGLSLVLRFLLLCCPLHGEKKKAMHLLGLFTRCDRAGMHTQTGFRPLLPLASSFYPLLGI